MYIAIYDENKKHITNVDNATYDLRFIIIFGVLEKQTVNKKRARGSKSSIIN